MSPYVNLEFNLELGDVTLHGVERGAGKRVIFLHGFPEHSYSWRHQMGPVAEAGFRAIAPDLRGYNLSSRPKGLRAYAADKVAADIVTLIERTGEGPVTLVGHDWGGVIAYQVAMQAPEKLERLILLNAPHLVSYKRALRRPDQFKKSWYAYLFQLPFVPERYTRANDFAVLRRVFQNATVTPNAVSAEDVETYINAFRPRGALTAAMNYYRAMLWMRSPKLCRIDVPTTVIYGVEDKFLNAEVVVPDARWVSNLTVHRVEKAGHFIQYDRPAQVNRLLLDILRSPPP